MRGARHLAALLGFAWLSVTGLPLFAASGRGERAKQAYDRAVSLRGVLESQPAHARTRADYEKVIRAFQVVYRTDPAYVKTPAALAAVAELYRERGREFSEDDDYEAAIKTSEFLVSQYPRASLTRDAWLAIGDIYNSDLARPAEARDAYRRFLEQYPKSAQAAAAQQALKQIEDAQAERAATEAASRQRSQPRPSSGQVLQVSGIRHWMGPDYTRIVVDVEDEVQFSAQRVANPDRLVFDLSNTRLSPALAGKTFSVEGGFLRQIRVAQYKPTVTRVVLDVKQIDDYSAFTLPNPFRLVIDVRGTPMASAAEASDLTKSGATTGARSTGTASSAPRGVLLEAAKNSGSSAAATSRHSEGNGVDSGSTGSEAGPNVGVSPGVATPVAETGGTASTPSLVVGGAKMPPSGASASDTTSSAADALPGASRAAVARAGSKTAGTLYFPAKPSASTEAGSRTLTRALGLKISRIVIDAGHGGHDTGTIGPGGLREKDVVLDVGLRLKKLIEAKMGSEVVMTRSDDTFIPLEERTAIANEKAADLFISIHANASRQPSARGIETYYLNFTSNPEALEVAARENATSQESVHRLQQLIEKIALTEKIEESRELARQVQRSVYAQIAQSAGQERDRGLKKAPFVVLIGANMPSILSEISFLTNPRDESLLKRASYRQKIAGALYRGIARYVNNLGGIKVAQESGAGLAGPPHPIRPGKRSSASPSSAADAPDF